MDSGAYGTILKEVLLPKFLAAFGDVPTVIVRAPGRVNIIGEHTDYNDGWVMPGAMSRSLFVLISPSRHYHHWIANDLDEEIQFEDSPDSLPLWAKYIDGTLRLYGPDHSFYNIVIGGDLPIGAGISSSSALTGGLLKGLQFLLEKNETSEALAIIASRVEREIIGLQGGIMDQYAIMLSEADRVMLLDCKTREREFIEAQLPGYKWLLINTKVKHSLIDSDYNNRAEQCRQAVTILKEKFPHITSLRDADMVMINAVALPEVLRKRSVFVVEENARVHTMVTALKNQDSELAGKLLQASHAGLRHLYEVSCPELDLIADVVNRNENVAGGRMMGGGFGGCVICLVKQTAIPPIVEEVTRHYHSAFGFDPEFITFSLSDGVALVS